MIIDTFAEIPKGKRVLVCCSTRWVDYEENIRRELVRNGNKVASTALRPQDVENEGFDFIIDINQACFRTDFNNSLCPLCGGETVPTFHVGPAGYYNECAVCEALILEDRSFCKTEYNEEYVDRLGGDVLHPKYALEGGDILFPHFEGKGSFLEIGFSNPAILVGLRRRGWCCTGMDMAISPAGKRFLRENGIKGIEGDITKTKIPNADVVWMSHVLEHLDNPFDVVSKLYESVNPGGLLFLAAPEAKCWFDGELIKTYLHMHPDQHFIMTSSKVIKEHLESLGAEVLVDDSDTKDELTYVHCYEWRLLVKKGEG